MVYNLEPLFNNVLRGMTRILIPLMQLNSSHRVTGLLRDLGWVLPSKQLFPGTFPDLIDAVTALRDAIYELEDANTDEAKGTKALNLIIKLKSTIDAIYQTISAIAQALNVTQELKDFRDNSGILNEFTLRLLDYLVSVYLQNQQSRLYGILNLLGIVEIQEITATSNWEPVPIGSKYPLRKVNWDRIPDFITDPLSLADKTYDWNPQKDFKASLFLSRLETLMRGFLIPGGLYRQDPTISTALGIIAVNTEELRIPIYQTGAWPDTYAEGGLNIAAVPDTDHPKGFAVVPYIFGVTNLKFDLTETWELDISGIAGLDKGIGLVIRPPKEIDVISDLFTGNKNFLPDYNLQISLKQKSGTDDEIVLIGSSGSSCLSIQGISLSFSASKSGQPPDIVIESKLNKISLVIGRGDGDGFIQKILPENPIKLESDVTFGWSRNKGVYINAAAALELTIQINKSLGPIFITTIDLKIDIEDKTISLITAVSGNASIGPVSASVEKIGLKTNLILDKPGILGKADLEFGFKPPSGMGLAIDAAVVKGGGFLEIEDGNYAGILQLDIQGVVSITAICILTTRMPDGSKTFALKLLGMAVFPPIQLGYGFILTGVGLAVAIECSMNTEALRAAVYAGRLNSLLFPPDPIKNAQQIISDLKDFFPPHPGYHVFGAMVRLGWGGATPLILADVGIFLQIGGPIIIALAGIIHSELPELNSPTIVLQCQVIGILDFGNKSLSIDASLTGSRIMDWPIDGGIALRSSWGDPARFAFSAGGFYPGYRIPEGFPSLARLSITLGSGNPRIGLFVYMALTENSVQFGAALLFHWQERIEIDLELTSIDLGLIEVDGQISFDALFKFNPFYFEAVMCAWLDLKRNGDSILSIDLRLALTGPNNYHAVGYAKAEICGCDVEVEFDETFGDIKPELSQEIISPLQALKNELEKKKNWSIELPSWGSNRVIFREGLDAEDLVDPMGGIGFRQKAVPLQYTLQKFGRGAIPEGEDWFDILPVPANDTSVIPLKDSFAPGEYVYLSDNDKVSAPPFEKLKSGMQTASNRIDIPGQRADKNMDYETKYSGETQYKIITIQLVPTALLNYQKIAGNRVHNKLNAKSPSDRSKGIIVNDQKFTVVTSDAIENKFSRATYAHKNTLASVGDLSYAQARQMQDKVGSSDSTILHVGKAAA